MQKSTVEKRLEVVEYSIHKCIVLLEERNSLETNNAKDNTNKQSELDHIRAELKSIKSLLLNRYLLKLFAESSGLQLPDFK